MRANKEITILADDSEGTLEELLKMIKGVGNTGHSFEIVVDPEEKEGLSDRTFYWDGDGADYIADVKVKEIKEVKESVMKNKRVQLEYETRNERKVKGKEHLISDAVDLEEDVAMEEDDIIKEPNTVIDLDKKGIDVTLKKEAFIRTLIKLIERNTGKKVILKK